MNHYVNLRSLAGVEPDVLEGDGLASPNMRILSQTEIARLAPGKDVLLAVHGLNVSYKGGITALARLEAAMGPLPNGLVLGVLWPGDFWIPVVNYPFEASDAVRCGKLLARFCDAHLGGARSLSFLSHSLGGRVVLEAVRRSSRRVRIMCIAAGAIDRDCLTGQYADALDNCDSTYVLSSTRDQVLRYAYPAGDFLSDIFGDGDSPFRSALGLRGPNPGAGGTVTPSAIPKSEHCNHGDYLSIQPVAGKVAGYAARAFTGAPQTWP